MSNNYVLKRRGNEYTLTTSDVVFRLAFTEYNRGVMLENFRYVWSKIEDGLIDSIRVFPATKATTVEKLTDILARKNTFTEDNFPPVRSMNKGGPLNPVGEYILPPGSTTKNSSTVGLVSPTPKANTGRR